MKMQFGTLRLAFAALALTGVLHTEAMTLYVAPDGNDNHSGHSEQITVNDGPFQTLARAQQEIRRMRADHAIPNDGLTIEMAPGRYQLADPLSFNDQDSGAPGAPIIYKAREIGKTIITGAVEITKTDEVSDTAVLDLLRPEARGQVRQIDLKSYFPADLPGFLAGSSYFGGSSDLPIWLFQNGERLTLAQWPREGYAKTGNFEGPSTGSGATQYFSSGKFHFDNDRLAIWAKEPDLYGYGSWGIEWIDQRLRVHSIDTIQKTIQLADPERNQYGFQPKRDFVFFNAISEISHPGDWAVDQAKKILYVWPASDPANYPLQLPIATSLVQAQLANSLHFEGIVFEGTRDTVLNFKYGKDIQLHGCTIRHTNGGGVRIQDSDHCSVIGCDLYDLGLGGVYLSGGDRQTLTPSKNTVENCHIYNFGRFISMYRPGVELGWKSVGAIVRHNLIHDSAHAAIIFDGNDHLIEYNIIHDVCQHSSDVGAVYCCARDWSKRGTVIRYNLIHALRPTGDTTVLRTGVYLDDHSSGTTVDGNIVTMATAAFQIGGGKDNVLTNNMALLCQSAVQYSSRGVDSFGADDARRGIKSQEFTTTYASPYLTPIWRARYPQIFPELQGDPVKAHDAAFNTIQNNIFACAGDIEILVSKAVMEKSKVDHNAIIDGDPGLVDPTKLDFNLKPDALGLKECPGFKPLPLDKMGLYSDPQRASPAVRFGPHVTALGPLLSRLQQSRDWPHAPVTIVPRGTVKIDGVSSPGEWNTSLDNAMVCSVPLVNNISKLSTEAWAQTDGTSLFILLLIDHDPKAAWVHSGKWGERDGFEIVVRNSHSVKAPTAHILFYPDRTFECVPVQAGSETWAKRLRNNIAYATQTSAQRWTAELSLPLATFNAVAGDNLFFNINVRRMDDDSWMAWVKPPGGFAETGDHGVLSLSTTNSP